MAFCIGGKWCRAQECRNRCRSWFGQQPDIERQCRKLCNNNISFSLLDPLDDRGRQEEELKKYAPVILGGGLMLLAALVVLIMVIRA